MTKLKKQSKITKLFRKGPAARKQKQPSATEDLENEVQQLEQKLKEKQNELFLLQRMCHKHKLSPVKAQLREDTFIRPQRIVLQNSVEHLRRSLELLGLVTGTEVTAYRSGEHCCVLYRMQQDHGLRILMGAHTGENQIASSALPLGFNLSAVLEDFDSVMTPECLGAVRKALVAYYDRLEQYHHLKEVAQLEAELFKTLDGSHVQISLYVQNEMEDGDEDDMVRVVLVLDYRLYDIRPKTYAIKDEEELPEGAADILRARCAVFKRKPLDVAFKEAFLNGLGNYQLVQQQASSPRRRPRAPPRAPYNPRQDDTFRPEQCSDSGDDDDDGDQ